MSQSLFNRVWCYFGSLSYSLEEKCDWNYAICDNLVKSNKARFRPRPHNEIAFALNGLRATGALFC
jgi:hypothetical protein